MKYEIEWLDDNWTRALVTQRRWRKPDRVTEVELRERVRDDDYGHRNWTWHHVHSDIPVDGAHAVLWKRQDKFAAFSTRDDGAGTGLQRVLSTARMRLVRQRAARIAAYAERERIRIRDAEQEAAWTEVRTMPTAIVLASGTSWWRRLLGWFGYHAHNAS